MTTRRFTRRELLKLTAAGAAVGTPRRLRDGRRLEGKVVVVGGGWAARRRQVPPSVVSGTIDVTLVEPNRTFVSCPISNLVIGAAGSSTS